MPRRGPAFPDAAWAAIVAAAEPHQPDREARKALDDIVHRHVAGAPDLSAAKRRRDRLAKLIKELGSAQNTLYSIRMRTPRLEDDSDPWLRRLRRLRVVLEVKREVEDEHAALAARIGAHQGKRNPERASLYEELLSLWVQHFGGRLSFSTSRPDGLPYGPIIFFILAVFEHALDERPPRPNTIAAIIKERRS